MLIWKSNGATDKYTKCLFVFIFFSFSGIEGDGRKLLSTDKCFDLQDENERQKRKIIYN